MSDHPLHLYLTWPDRETALEKLKAVLGEGVESMPLDGNWNGIHYSSVVWGSLMDDQGNSVPGFHVGLWIHATPEQMSLLPDFGATVCTEAEIEPWHPRLG